jgi:hypothetical protein
MDSTTERSKDNTDVSWNQAILEYGTDSSTSISKVSNQNDNQKLDKNDNYVHFGDQTSDEIQLENPIDDTFNPNDPGFLSDHEFGFTPFHNYGLKDNEEIEKDKSKNNNGLTNSINVDMIPTVNSDLVYNQIKYRLSDSDVTNSDEDENSQTYQINHLETLRAFSALPEGDYLNSSPEGNPISFSSRMSSSEGDHISSSEGDQSSSSEGDQLSSSEGDSETN